MFSLKIMKFLYFVFSWEKLLVVLLMAVAAPIIYLLPPVVLAVSYVLNLAINRFGQRA